MKDAIVLTAKFMAKKGSESKVKDELLTLVEPTRKEKGSILYNFHTEADNKNAFVFYEIWENKELLNLHAQGEHFNNVMNTIKDHLEKPAEVVFLDKIR